MMGYQEFDHTLDQSVRHQLNYPSFQYMDSSCHASDNAFRSTSLMDIKSTETCAVDFLTNENMIGQPAHEKLFPLYLDPDDSQPSRTVPPISPVCKPYPASYFSLQSLGNQPGYSPLSVQCVPSTPTSSYSLPTYGTPLAITPAATGPTFYHPLTTPVNDYPSPIAWQYTPISDILSSQDSLSSSFSLDSSSSFLQPVTNSLSHEGYPPYSITSNFELAMPPKRRGVASNTTPLITGSAGAARGLSKAIQSRKKRVYAQQESETPAQNLILKSVPEDPTLDIDKGSMDSTKELRFHIVLEAPTAAAQKTGDESLTYLNRGQLYAIRLNDTYSSAGKLTSTFALTFHSSAHRKVASNYWKFWMSQQRATHHARAVEIDLDRSVGIVQAQVSEFDRVSFEWDGSQGATLYVRLNCLSTDFSRIKGVKGIPMRAYMETKMNFAAPSPTLGYYPKPCEDVDNPYGTYDYVERCFCKIKLFRDKGAERKIKDDAKQINRHLEKLYSEGNHKTNPLWNIYNRRAISHSLFQSIPSSPLMEPFKDDPGQFDISDSLSTPPLLIAAPFDTTYPSYIDGFTGITLESAMRTHPDVDLITMNSNNLSNTMLPCQTRGINFYVDIKTTQHQCFQASASAQGKSPRLQALYLPSLTLSALISCLSDKLSLHPSQVSEVLCSRTRRLDANTFSGWSERRKQDEESYMSVTDSVLVQYLSDHAVMLVEWEIKPNGTVRLLLQF
ncbi:CP2 transcription factor-domain-containing protein [Phycomyces nitens]|nr:CP2 transcription factor-domain-containing protein [Phycomyces nitens]